MSSHEESSQYKTSSFCANGRCVEVAQRPDGRIAIRDSHNEHTGELFTAEDWRLFVAGVKAGEFDFPDPRS